MAQFFTSMLLFNVHIYTEATSMGYNMTIHVTFIQTKILDKNWSMAWKIITSDSLSGQIRSSDKFIISNDKYSLGHCVPISIEPFYLKCLWAISHWSYLFANILMAFNIQLFMKATFVYMLQTYVIILFYRKLYYRKRALLYIKRLISRTKNISYERLR